MEFKELMVKKTNYVYLFILLTACLVVYSNSIKRTFSSFDDPEEVFYNETLTDTTLPGFVNLFAKPRIYGFYAPVKYVVHWCNYAVTGSFNPAYFHSVNVGLHVLNVFCCYIFLVLLTKNNRYSFLVALLFAIHPCHDHPVNGVAARGLLLVGLFSFLSLIFYLLAEQRGLAGAAGEAVPAEKPHEWTYYPLSVICFALGIFSHPLIVTLPIIILVYQLLIADEDNTTIYQRLPGAFKKTAPFFIIVVFYFAVSQMYFHPTSKMVSVHDTPQRAASRPVEKQVKIGTDLLATYFINALGAFNRNHSDMAVLSVFEKIVIFTGMIVFFRAGLWKLKRRRWRALAPFIFFVSLLPSFFMTYSYSNINLRYMYFASTGVFMLVFAILEAYISDAPENKSSKALIYGLIIAFLVFLGYISHYRNAHPMDRQTNPGDMGTKLWCEKTFGYTVPPKLYMHRR